MFFQLRPYNSIKFNLNLLLWTTHGQDSTKVNYVFLIAGDVVLYLLRYMEAFFIGTHLLLFTMTSLPLILICLAHLSSNSKYIVLTSFVLSQCVSHLPFVNMNLVLIFNSSNDGWLQVSDCFQFCASLTP